MASDTLSSAASILYEMRADLEAIYPRDVVLLAEWSGYNAITGESGDGKSRLTPLNNRDAFSGSQVRIPLDFAQLQGGGWVAETGTINQPIADIITQATITLKRVVVPASITLDLEEDSMSNSAVAYLGRKMDKAKDALAMLVDEAMNGAGDAKLADITDSATSLTITAAAGTDFDKLLPGTVVDVRTKANGADPGQGLRRRIASFVESTGVITFDTAQQAADGGSGNIVHTSAEGIYVAGSYGNYLAGGLQAAAAQSGTFQGVNRTTYPMFRATDGRAGVTTTVPISDPMLDAAVISGQRAGTFKYDFGYGDPAAINAYKNSKLSLVNYNTPTGVLKSGFKGIEYNGAGQPIPLIPSRKAPVASLYLLDKSAATLYGRRKGPDFDDKTGSIFMRFARSLPTEFWLVDRLEWGWHNPAGITYFTSLALS